MGWFWKYSVSICTTCLASVRVCRSRLLSGWAVSMAADPPPEYAAAAVSLGWARNVSRSHRRYRWCFFTTMDLIWPAQRALFSSASVTPANFAAPRSSKSSRTGGGAAGRPACRAALYGAGLAFPCNLPGVVLRGAGCRRGLLFVASGGREFSAALEVGVQSRRRKHRLVFQVKPGREIGVLDRQAALGGRFFVAQRFPPGTLKEQRPQKSAVQATFERRQAAASGRQAGPYAGTRDRQPSGSALAGT